MIVAPPPLRGLQVVGEPPRQTRLQGPLAVVEVREHSLMLQCWRCRAVMVVAVGRPCRHMHLEDEPRDDQHAML